MKRIKRGQLIGALFILMPLIAMLAIIPGASIRNWTDTTALVEDARITKEELFEAENSSSKHRYLLEFSYVIFMKTSAGSLRFEGTEEITGLTNEDKIPASAYESFVPGKRVEVCYNPKNPEKYRFGTVQDAMEWRMVGIVVSLIVMLPGIPILLVSTFRRKTSRFDIMLPRAVKLPRVVTAEEVFEALTREKDLPEPYMHTGPYGSPCVYIPGDKKWDIAIVTGKKKGKLTICNTRRLKGIIGRTIAERYVPGLHYLNYSSNHELFDAVVETCRRLFR
jgi:hypothetical protein